jgi:hypothetical protein
MLQQFSSQFRYFDESWLLATQWDRGRPRVGRFNVIESFSMESRRAEARLKA